MARLKTAPTIGVAVTAGFAAVAVLHSFYIQEILAALALFTVLFVCLAVLAGLLFIIDRVSIAAIDLMYSGAKHVVRYVRQHGILPEPHVRF